MATNKIELNSGWKTLFDDFYAEHMPEERLRTRLQKEAEARSLMESKLGSFSSDDIHAFLKLLNGDYWNGKELSNRFMPAFYGHSANLIAECKDAFNKWAKALWTTQVSELPQILNDLWATNEIVGAGTSLPTAILYLRDPEKYAIWIAAMEGGIKAVLPEMKFGKRKTAEGYEAFNSVFQGMRSQAQREPQAMDVLLSLASKRSSGSENGFEVLFQDFITSFVDSDEGVKHIAAYPKHREEAKKNYEMICQKKDAGEDVTDLVLLKLLPHADTEYNRSRNAWVHIAPSVTRDIKQWFEGAKWTTPDSWPKVSSCILQFVQSCLKQPDELEKHCRWFVDNCPSKGLQAGLLSHILNALNPKRFSIVNTKPKEVINFFCRTRHETQLLDYPNLNAELLSFHSKHSELLSEVAEQGPRGPVFRNSPKRYSQLDKQKRPRGQRMALILPVF